MPDYESRNREQLRRGGVLSPFIFAPFVKIWYNHDRGDTIMGEKFRQLKWADRLQLEVLLKAGHSKAEIAKLLKVHRSTIYNELKRGQYEHRNSDYTVEMRYSPDIAQRKCDENLQIRGTQLKIANDIEYAEYIENKIIEYDYSPAAVLGELRAQGKEELFKTKICVTTLYSYIDKGIFLRLTNQNLPVKKERKRDYKKVQKQQKRATAGESIEHRPDDIETREEFGNWEMDTVKGKQGKTKSSLLVLTERKTRAEIIFKLPSHTAESVVAALDCLERKWGDMFQKVFRTITVDNGSEFAYCDEMEHSVLGNGKRTKLYYCHPYSSWERGTNEVTNKMVRRKVPKGTDFDDRTDDEIEEIQNWINNYPRSIHDYHTASERFNEELDKMA